MQRVQLNLRWAIVGSIAAFALSMLAVTLTQQISLYALTLFPLFITLWVITRLSSREIGSRLEIRCPYTLAILHPIGVVGLTALIAWLGGGIRVNLIDRDRFIVNLVAQFILNFALVLLTEEGFFRGWLWGILERSRRSPRLILVWTSLLFSLWSLPLFFLQAESGRSFSILPIAIALFNFFLLGTIWGCLRFQTGSVIAPALCHALWNALTYILFGIGGSTGLFAITASELYDPQRGILGIVLNLLIVMTLKPWQIGQQRCWTDDLDESNG
jgi:hypothetical protein